ncbi:hypothetical protein RZS08_61750, partial [Arthrospira platensis SPKY1]|nr:hypothetical protein [Arthrospira platensis SPKY1]
MVSVKDLRPEHSVNQQLGETRDRFESISQNLGIGLFRAAADRNLSLLELNSAAKTLLGISPDIDISVLGLADLIPNPDDLKEFLAKLGRFPTVSDQVIV